MASPKRPLVLVTNDDGFDAPGIAVLRDAMERFAEVVVVAPDRERSGAGHALTLDRPLRVYQCMPGQFRVSGTPTDCVHLGVFALTEGRLPNLVVSGINRGLNIGDDVTYSGTVAAALEGTLLHLPALAFSSAVDADGRVDFERAADFVGRLAKGVLDRGLPDGVLLNVNFPVGAARGLRWTRQSTRRYRATAEERLDPSGRPYYWIAAADTVPADEPDGDHQAIRDGWISITPLHSNMTHVESISRMCDWPLGFE